MAKQVPSFPLGKQPQSIFEFLRKTGNKTWNYVIPGTTGLLVLALLLYGILTWSTDNSKIQYKPADVVYGEKIHAVHNMGLGSVSQTSTYFLTSLSANPEIRLSEIFYDFGEVNTQQVLTRTFVIANLGKSPLVILRAYTTCGCTVADFTASEIPPGKVALMTLQFNTGFHDMRGTTVRRGVVIETNDPDHPIQEIWVQASVR